MKIDHTSSPTHQDIEFLMRKINQEIPGFGEAYPFAFFIRDEKGNILAGCNGSVIFGAIYTDQLWVHPDYRRQGLGRKLMERVHGYGQKQGCALATAATMSFQNARSFYERLGYVSDFERPGYVKGQSLLCLKKDLNAPLTTAAN